MSRSIPLTCIVSTLLMTLPAFAQDTGHPPDLDEASAERLYKKPGYSPYAGRNFPSRVF